MAQVKITSSQVTKTDVHGFAADASELGLAPGEWPTSLPTDLGNGLNFIRSRPLFRRTLEEAQGVIYQQDGGCISLTVFND